MEKILWQEYHITSMKQSSGSRSIKAYITTIKKKMSIQMKYTIATK